MPRDDWLVGGDRREIAAERIYDAATDLMTREGPGALDIDTLASQVHCSRATIYRYVGGKAEIRDTVLARAGARIIESVRQAVQKLSGPERVITAITVALNADSSTELTNPTRKSTELRSAASSRLASVNSTMCAARTTA